LIPFGLTPFYQISSFYEKGGEKKEREEKKKGEVVSSAGIPLSGRQKSRTPFQSRRPFGLVGRGGGGEKKGRGAISETPRALVGFYVHATNGNTRIMEKRKKKPREKKAKKMRGTIVCYELTYFDLSTQRKEKKKDPDGNRKSL